MAIRPTMGTSPRPGLTISSSSVVPLTCSPAITAFTPPRMRSPLSCLGSPRSTFPSRGRAPPRQAYKRQEWFQNGQRFRAGIEGRTNVLRRRGYLGRCRGKAEGGFGRWVSWGVIVANLITIARSVAVRA